MKRLFLVIGILSFVTSGQVFPWANAGNPKPCGPVPGPGYCVCWITAKMPGKIPIPGTGRCEPGDSEGYIGCLRDSECPFSTRGPGEFVLRPSTFPEYNLGPLVPISFWGPVFLVQDGSRAGSRQFFQNG